MKVWTLYLFTVFFLPQFLPIFAQSQQGNAIADSLFTVGKTLLAQGDKKGATSAFNKALAKNKTLLNARIELGKMAIAEKKWSKAGQEFDAILELDPKNLAAHYYRAICHREYGKFRLLLARVLDWPKAEKHFKQVMARDSLYQDILYQFALLQRYRGKYTEAINLCYDQIRLRPELLQPKLDLYQFYRSFIRHKNEKEVLAWLERQKWQQARYFIGESLRRDGKLVEADSVLQALLAAEPSMSKQPIYLSLARIHYKQGNKVLAEKYFWLAVDSIHTQLDAELIFEDIKYIVTDEELNTFRALKDNAAQIKFFHTFWTRRDPTPAAVVNARLVEHYRRLNYAEEYYEYDGFRTYFNSSDPLNYFQFPQSYALNHEFDDRGLVYLRHGPPDDQIVTVGAGSGSAPSNESWKYWQRDEEPELTFHFLKLADVWLLSPTLPASLSMSDIVLASNITPASSDGKFVKNGLQIVPNPTRQFPHNQPIHIYFEIYNLKLDADGQSAFTIEYTLSRTDKQRGVKKLFGLFGGGRKTSISVRSERQGRSAFSPENIAVDSSKLKKGE